MGPLWPVPVADSGSKTSSPDVSVAAGALALTVGWFVLATRQPLLVIHRWTAILLTLCRGVGTGEYRGLAGCSECGRLVVPVESEMRNCLQSRGPWNGRSGWVLTIVAAVFASPLVAQETSEARPAGQFLKKVFKDEQGSHQYQVFLPAGYDAEKRYPTILYLHGSDECGRDGVKQVQIGLGPLVRARADKFPFIVVFPQCETIRGRRR